MKRPIPRNGLSTPTDEDRAWRVLEGLCPECGGSVQWEWGDGGEPIMHHTKDCPKNPKAMFAADYDDDYETYDYGKRGTAQWKDDAFYTTGGSKKARRGLR